MSLTPNRDEIIKFLVHRKFRSVLAVLSSPPIQPRASRATTLERALGAQERDRYRSELQALPSEQLQSLYEDESAKALADLQREEEARWFNQPHAVADFDHWSKAEHWSLDEAVALILGKAPEIVSWSRIESLSEVSPFVKKYGRLRDLAQRATAWKKLYDPVLPLLFLKWAKENDIEIPTALENKIEKFKGKLVDWKKEFEQQKAAYDQLDTAFDKWRSMYDQQVADWKNLVDQKLKDLAEATKRIAELEAELAAGKDTPRDIGPSKSQSPIERQNMLKAIYVMAIKGYAYKPDEKRSTTIADIVSDLSLEGLPVSDDTIRRYLKEAREHLSEWQE
jgi:hypothetical protein